MSKLITSIVLAGGLALAANAQAGPYYHPGKGKPVHTQTVTVHHHHTYHYPPGHRPAPRHAHVHHYHAPRTYYRPAPPPRYRGPVRRVTYVHYPPPPPPPPPPRVGISVHFGY